MLLLYLQPLRMASIYIDNSQIGNSQISYPHARSTDRAQKRLIELPPASAKSAERDCQPESGQPEFQSTDRTMQRYFLERRLFL